MPFSIFPFCPFLLSENKTFRKTRPSSFTMIKKQSYWLSRIGTWLIKFRMKTISSNFIATSYTPLVIVYNSYKAECNSNQNLEIKLINLLMAPVEMFQPSYIKVHWEANIWVVILSLFHASKIKLIFKPYNVSFLIVV